MTNARRFGQCLAPLLAFCIAGSGCVTTAAPKHQSTARTWLDSRAALIAKLSDAIAASPWVKSHKSRVVRPPVVRFESVENKTGGPLDVARVRSDIKEAIVAKGKAITVALTEQELGKIYQPGDLRRPRTEPDFVMTVAVLKEPDFALAVEVTSAKSGKSVWTTAIR